MGTQIQKWGSYEPEEAARDKKEVERKGLFFKIKNDKTTLRFLPPRQGLRNPFVKTWQHYVELIEGDESSIVIYNCPKKMRISPHCPLCAKSEKLFATGGKKEQDRAYELRPKLRVYAAIIDRGDEDKGVQTFAFGQKIFEQLINVRDEGDYTNPGSDGFDILIYRKGRGQRDTTYDVKPQRQGSMLHEDPRQIDEWIASIPDLLQNAYVPSPEEIQEKIDAALSEKSEDEDDRRGRARGQRGSSRGDEGDTVDTTGEAVDGEQEDLWGR